MTAAAGGQPTGGRPRIRDLHWNGQAVRVTTPVPAAVWQAVAAADTSVTPFQTPTWRDCVCASGEWRDASRCYELPSGRMLVLMMARRSGWPAMLAQEASWPTGWGSGGLLADGGTHPDDVALVTADLAHKGVLSTTVRPSFSAAPAWPDSVPGAFTIRRAVHVAHLERSFEDFWAGSLTKRSRAKIRTASRHAEAAGIVFVSGNSPDLVQAFYEVYLSWIDWRARQRRLPRPVARWQAGRLEPLPRFATVASKLGEDCRIWVASWDGRPVGAAISLYAGDTAIGWRAFTDRSVPYRFRLHELLITRRIQEACERGCRYLELGESVGTRSLAAVKERMGGREHLFAEYCFERLPLSPARVAFQRFRGRAEAWLLSHQPQPESEAAA
jgi:CelD/BcsL family acetyltransferase involved in cellulose biosynthesis